MEMKPYLAKYIHLSGLHYFKNSWEYLLELLLYNAHQQRKELKQDITLSEVQIFT